MPCDKAWPIRGSQRGSHSNRLKNSVVPGLARNNQRLAVILMELLQKRCSLSAGAARGEQVKHHTEPENEGNRDESKPKR